MNTSVLLVLLVIVVGFLAVWVAMISGQVRGLQRQVDERRPSPSGHEPGSAPTVPPATPVQATSAERAGLSAEGELLVRQALADGDRIEAVKFVREETGMGLREANQYVKTLERRG